MLKHVHLLITTANLELPADYYFFVHEHDVILKGIQKKKKKRETCKRKASDPTMQASHEKVPPGFPP